MCRNQLGRRNITDEQKTALIGEAYKAQKMAQGGERGTERDKETGKFTAGSTLDHAERAPKTGEKIAKEFGVGYGTVLRAENYVDGLNEAEKFSPGIKEAVLSGSIKAPKSVISEIRNAPEERRRRGARLRY